MQLNLKLNQYAEKILPSAVYKKAQPLLSKVEGALDGDDDTSVSRRTALIVFSIRIASAAIAYFSQVFLARWIGDFDYGIYVAVWVAIVMVGGLSCLGFSTGIIRFISEYRTAKSFSLLRGVLYGAFLWPIFSATIIAIIGASIIYASGDLIFENHFLIPIYLSLICLPMFALQEIQDGSARAYDWPNVALLPTFILRPLLILCVMALSIWLGFEASAATAMIASIVAVYVAGIVQTIALYPRLRKAVPKGTKTFETKSWFKITIPLFLADGFYNLLTNVDILILAAFVSPEKVGIYFAAAKTLALVHFVYFAVKAASAHRFAAYNAAGDKQKYEDFIRETIHWTFWPSLALALVMVVLGKYFLMLFGPSFAIGESVIWIMTIGIVIRASVGAAESILAMSGKQNHCAAIYAGTLLLAVILNIVLIPIYGLNGAALATTLALSVETLALYITARISLGLHIFIIPKRRNDTLTQETAK